MVATAAATSNAALQRLCSTPKQPRSSATTKAARASSQLSSSWRMASTESTVQEVDSEISKNRYRLLDEDEQRRQAVEVERIVAELKAQHRHRRRPSSASRGSSDSAPRRSGTPTLRNESRSPSSRRPRTPRDRSESPPPYDPAIALESPGAGDEGAAPMMDWTDDEGDAQEDRRTSATVAPAPPQAFQEQILRELRELKQAQQRDLEAIQLLRQEKEAAERRAQALEARVRARQKDGDHHRPRTRPAFEFSDGPGGDESLAPPEFDDQFEEPSPMVPTLDLTDTESSPDKATSRSGRWAKPASAADNGAGPELQRSASPETVRRATRSTRPQSARSGRSSRFLDSDDDNDEEIAASDALERGRRRERTSQLSKVHRDSREQRTSRSRGSSANRSQRPRSASREDLRRSCPFFEAKRRAQEEEAQREREAQERLARATRATPPANLLKRQEAAQRRKEEHIRAIDRELHAELSPTRRVRAREVPTTTYVAADAIEEREQARKERILRRSQETLAGAQLPTRMKLAHEEELKTKSILESGPTREQQHQMSVKVRRQLQAQAEEEAARLARRPKPVPNFSQLQQQWDKALSVKKSRATPTVPEAFFTKRTQELEGLQARKEARKRKQAEEAERQRQAKLAEQQALLERVRATAPTVKRSDSGDLSSRSTGSKGGDAPRLTKGDELRLRKVQAALRQAQRAKEQEQLDAELRAARLREASKRVAAQVRASEQKRKGDYAGDFVELTSVESVAKERARAQRQQFKEAIQRNKDKIQQAIATRPSLMDRFTTELQREEHKKNALAAVVKNVFQGNLKAMKGILTETEEDLARDLVAAEAEVAAGEDYDDNGRGRATSHPKSKKSEDKDEGDENDAYADDE